MIKFISFSLTKAISAIHIKYNQMEKKIEKGVCWEDLPEETMRMMVLTGRGEIDIFINKNLRRSDIGLPSIFIFS
jgi:hypothetical protein